MNLNLGTGGFGGRALPFSVLAVFAAAGLTSCAGKSATAPTPPGTATYEGVFAGGKGENGVLTITVPAATSAPALSHTTTRASLGVASSPFDVTGTLAFVGGGSVNQAFADFRYGGAAGKNVQYRFYGKGFSRGPEFENHARCKDESSAPTAITPG